MMKLPQLSNAQGQLLAKVGSGLQLLGNEGSLQLTFHTHTAARAGLVLAAQVDGRPVSFWLDEQQWCQWITPMLVTPSLALTPPELLLPLALWTLADARDDVAEMVTAWPEAVSLQAGECRQSGYWQLQLQRAGRQLDLLLLTGDDTWLDALSDNMFPVAAAAGTPERRLTASLLAGWTQTDAAMLQALQPGDALLLQTCFAVGHGRVALFLERPLAVLEQQSGAGGFYVEAIMSDFEDWMDVAPAVAAHDGLTQALAEASVTVTVEVAQIALSLQELSRLEVGGLLSGELRQDALVTLKVGARAIARGTLLDIDSRLAVRIDHFC